MLGAIIILITFVVGQCIAHYSKWVQSKSLLVLLLVSVLFIGCSMGAYVMLGLQSPYVLYRQFYVQRVYLQNIDLRAWH